MSKLKTTAIGYLGRDCSEKHLDGGNVAINFSIACTETWKDKSGVKQQRTTWVDCVLWRKPENRKIAEYLKKGTLVSVEGKPEVRAYLGRDGEARAVLQLRVDELILLGKGTASDNAAPAASEPVAENTMNDNETFVPPVMEDDLPF